MKLLKRIFSHVLSIESLIIIFLWVFVFINNWKIALPLVFIFGYHILRGHK